jgi:hypothetical protein
LQEGCAPVVEVHAALLINEGLQKFEFRVGEFGCLG